MGRAFSRPFPGADIPESALTGPEKCDSFLMSEKESCASPLSHPKELTYTEGYRSGHNGAVLKTVRGQPHAGSNPAPSAMRKDIGQRPVSFLISKSGFEPEGSWQHAGGMLQPEEACPAGQVESCTLRHEKRHRPKAGVFSHKQSGIAVYLDGDPVFYGRSVSRSRVRALLR